MLAVVDVETTGLGRNDRIVEIGVVWVDDQGTECDYFETLVNPLRDVGPTSIHGVTASMVSAAPTFDEIAGYVGERLQGCVLVAHNLTFDTRMLRQEFDRVNAELRPGDGICTLRATGERLDVACDRLGIEREQDHSAGSDARATALLAAAAVDFASLNPVPASISGSFASVPIRSLTRRTIGCEATVGPVVALSRSATLPSGPDNALIYGEALDRVLLDGRIAEAERDGLSDLATDLGLGVEEVKAIQADYLERLIRAVERDGIVTAEEETLVHQIAEELALSGTKLPTADAPAIDGTRLAPGMRLCFTGEAVSADGEQIERSKLEALAAANGLITEASFTKKRCDALVASDPNSASSKATKARNWGKPIFSVAEFLAYCSADD